MVCKCPRTNTALNITAGTDPAINPAIIRNIPDEKAHILKDSSVSTRLAVSMVSTAHKARTSAG